MLRLLTLLVLLLAAPALAQAPDPYGQLAGDGYAEIEAGVSGLAASGDPRADAILSALSDGRLLVRPADRTLLIRQGGTLVDARTGAAAADSPDLKPVRANNRVRRAIEAARGQLDLASPDPGKRRIAADAVFKARDAAALPALDAALARETSAPVRQALTEARAAVLLARPGTAETDRIGAIPAIQARGDGDAMGILRGLAADPSEAVRNAAARGIAAIETRLAILGALQNVWYGISLGSVLLLAAIGLAITFGVMGVINMAHGEMVMLGAYTTYGVQELIRTQAPSLFGWSLAISIPCAFLVAGLVGVLIERFIIRFLYGRPLETLLATFGVSLALQQGVRSIFGPTNREVGAPAFMSGAFDFYGLSITWGRMWIIAFALAVFLGLLFVLRKTSFGLKTRAVTQNRRMAAAMGIRTPYVDALTFGLGSGIAGIAGVALSQIDNVSPNLGQGYIIDSFLVVVFGGVGNLWGTLVAALTLGVVNKLAEPYVGAVLAKIGLLVFIILFIQKRPRGLFALKGRAVES
ncbi:urea ABC transporter permease subunit UrtB [Methylobacterium sp. XJLW]|uniref:Urea ABC transporter, permease protein UrtB n=1 Tax=Methylobacterium oryzae CBMB20 TaxID=693986 RepID=A0A089NQ68_9HYPH|nr:MULTISPECIES: urea ABC transporter permease subunit UrtB [Methylobacterium]AIQ89542.1 Urea ABC transporter, permease protein UrtB [Methylobacterium oryzae CBMB20]AWV18148.1 urea ABC transporter permease subunit UrtB [Methylobacterium sp. XJLW]WFS09314.1 urea ABC transporter permease subunit UrtB [Methylobacterium sp. 391_Methyba4]